jgi:hypothetical protein
VDVGYYEFGHAPPEMWNAKAASCKTWGIGVLDPSLDLRGNISRFEYGQRRCRLRIISWELLREI